jgi:hypothetical protein
MLENAVTFVDRTPFRKIEIEEESTMKKFKITIEETVSETFDIEAETMEEAMEIAENEYNNGFLVVENPTLVAKQMMAEDEETNEATEWVEF